MKSRRAKEILELALSALSSNLDEINEAMGECDHEDCKRVPVTEEEVAYVLQEIKSFPHWDEDEEDEEPYDPCDSSSH